jgi:hypothetical protein
MSLVLEMYEVLDNDEQHAGRVAETRTTLICPY